ncbi:MAG TPA: FAD-dependent oxidoreductase [Prochlorococcaceae cyanobacterium AMR_MDS_5431]|nr:FAD-dependent oxidoreductase [Prochlorococcaceae cyanobacterium AMR_MDS_5431]
MTIKSRTVSIVGAGTIGLALAWHLHNLGYRIKLIDPQLANLIQAKSSSFAATGILMGCTYKRNKGRSWQLRKRSISLWPQWCASLQRYSQNLTYRAGILFLASNQFEENWQKEVLLRSSKIHMRQWNRQRLDSLRPEIPKSISSGLFSPEDGQIDPKAILTCIYSQVMNKEIEIIPKRVKKVTRLKDFWRLQFDCGQSLTSHWTILCTGSNCTPNENSNSFETQKIRGQSLHLKLATIISNQWEYWPGSISWRGNSLVPISNNEYWIGSTIETDNRTTGSALNSLLNRHHIAPEWLKKSNIIKHWQGIRSRPIYRSSPILQLVAPRLILATAFYRNGILLTPSTVEWILKCVRIVDKRCIYEAG